MWLGSNTASLLNGISNSCFAGRDLSDTTLTQAYLPQADLRGTKLKNTRLNGTVLTGAKFYRSDIALSRINNTRFSFYVSTELLRHHISQFVTETTVLFQAGVKVKVKPYSAFGGEFLTEMTVAVKDIQHLELLREKLANAISTSVAFYFDECEELAREQALAKV